LTTLIFQSNTDLNYCQSSSYILVNNVVYPCQRQIVNIDIFNNFCINDLTWFVCRSRDSDGPQSRGSRERESHRRSDEREERRGDERREDGPAKEPEAGGATEDKGGDRNGEYNGPAGMQPDGLIEVSC